jgi:Tfp pilus assembly protein PilV
MKARLLKHYGGFTLIEAMITVGVSCVAILALSQVMVVGLTGTAKTHGAIAFQSLVSEIRIDFLNQPGCTASLVNLVPYKLTAGQHIGDPGTTTANSKATTIFLPDGVTPLAQTTKPFGSVNNLQFALYDLGPIAAANKCHSHHWN